MRCIVSFSVILYFLFIFKSLSFVFVIELGALSTTELISEIKKLHDEAYKLGVQESKEMTRGRYLNIFSNVKKKS